MQTVEVTLTWNQASSVQ